MDYHFCVFSEKKQRVDIYLSALFWEFSRSYIQKLIDKGQVLVNGKTLQKNSKIQKKDEIYIQQLRESTDLQAENIPLDIVHEDTRLLVINKDPGINVHPTPGIDGKTGTLVNAILYHCQQDLPCISGEERPGIVHRLDKDTSGLIMIAKDDSIMRELSQKIHDRQVKKYYIALVEGLLEDREFTIEGDIGRDPYDRTKMTVKHPLNPKHARTHVQLLWYIEERYSVIKVDLETGRTHQIRVHLSHMGFPIVWDKVYGNKDKNDFALKHYSISRQMLHAYELFLEIFWKKYHFLAPLKHDMAEMIPENIKL